MHERSHLALDALKLLITLLVRYMTTWLGMFTRDYGSPGSVLLRIDESTSNGVKTASALLQDPVWTGTATLQ